MRIDSTTMGLIRLWKEHQADKPDAPEEYLVNIDHLRQAMDIWTAHDAAYRLVIGSMLASQALRDTETGDRDE